MPELTGRLHDKLVIHMQSRQGCQRMFEKAREQELPVSV